MGLRSCFLAFFVLLLACGDDAPAGAPAGAAGAAGGGAGGQAGAAGAGASGQAGEAGAGGAAGAAGQAEMAGMAGMAGMAPVLPPLPAVEGLVELEDTNPDPTVVEVNLTAKPADVAIKAGKETAALTYNGLLPGPMIHARVGDRVIVHFTNEMAEPTVTHWHGLRISDLMDGSPVLQDPVQPGETFTYDFVVPDAGTFWYHTHLHQIEQFERGLYGGLVVHEAEPPVFTAERIFMVDDIRLDTGNQVSPFLTSGPDIGRGRIGNTVLVNGKVAPGKLALARGAVERWRVVLSTNALSMDLRMNGAKARVISTDGGLLPEPFDLDRVHIAPGQRYDLEVRALDDASEVSLEGLVPTLDELGKPIEQVLPLLAAKVEGEVSAEEPVYPAVTLPETVVVAEKLKIHLSGNNTGKVQFTINDQASSVATEHDHAPLATFLQGTPVQITLTSNVSPEHPFHIHGQFFQITKRNGKKVFEPGLRDTVLVKSTESVTVLSYFENPGSWMVHCHISEHAENGMMATIQVNSGDPAQDQHGH